MTCLVVEGESGGGDGDAAQAVQTLHRRRDDHHPPPDGLTVHDIRAPVPRLRVERVQPRGTQGKRVRLKNVSCMCRRAVNGIP